MEVKVKDEFYLVIWNAVLLTNELNIMVMSLRTIEFGKNFIQNPGLKD